MSRNLSASPKPVVVRPSSKLIRPWYTVAFVLAAIVLGYNNNREDRADWLLILPVIVLLVTAWLHFKLRFTSLTFSGARLRFEQGMGSRETQTMDLSKIQNVRVRQSIFQRMTGTGDIIVESSGETGLITMRNIDAPQTIADYILESAKK